MHIGIFIKHKFYKYSAFAFQAAMSSKTHNSVAFSPQTNYTA
jgi:hypothetical protein